MDASDRLKMVIEQFRNRRHDGNHSEQELELIHGGNPALAVQNFCIHLYEDKLPLTEAEWQEIRQIAQHLNASIKDLRPLVQN